jgi:ribosomal protein S18 acetylase RimI-like enzyme
MINIQKIDEDRWPEYRDLRLNALTSEPRAYGSSYDEEIQLSEDQWKDRIKNTIFALNDDKLIGMLALVLERNQKMNHIANIFGVYVKAEFRRQHVATQLFQYVFSHLQANKNIIKIRLQVNLMQKAAVKFYKKMGFKVVGLLKKELRLETTYYDELIMEKFL